MPDVYVVLAGGDGTPVKFTGNVGDVIKVRGVRVTTLTDVEVIALYTAQ